MTSSSPVADSETHVVELTPTGRAAVTVVLVAGPGAVRSVDDCFTPVGGRSIAVAPLRRIMLGRWGGREGEELVACRLAENEVEVHCHGGATAVRAVIDALVAQLPPIKFGRDQKEAIRDRFRMFCDPSLQIPSFEQSYTLQRRFLKCLKFPRVQIDDQRNF